MARTRRTGRHVAEPEGGEDADFRLASQLQAEELSIFDQTVNGRRLAMRLGGHRQHEPQPAQSANEPEPEIERGNTENNEAPDDNASANGDGGREQGDPRPANGPEPEVERDAPGDEANPNNDPPPNGIDRGNSSLSDESSDTDDDETETVHCLYCLCDKLTNSSTQFPCGHPACFECLDRRLRLAARDISLYPAECCGKPIPRDILGQRLSPEDLKWYLEKEVEFTT